MAMFSEPCLGPTDTEVELLSWMFLPSMEKSLSLFVSIFLSIHERLGDVWQAVQAGDQSSWEGL